MNLPLNYISIITQRISWEDSINLVSLPLLENNHITTDYVPAIFRSIEQIGMYIVIDPSIALPHARPENGVLKNGISILKSNHPITFNDSSNNVQLVIMFCSVDNTSHIQMITDLANIIGNRKTLDSILNSSSELGIFHIFNQGASS